MGRERKEGGGRSGGTFFLFHDLQLLSKTSLLSITLHQPGVEFSQLEEGKGRGKRKTCLTHNHSFNFYTVQLWIVDTLGGGSWSCLVHYREVVPLSEVANGHTGEEAGVLSTVERLSLSAITGQLGWSSSLHRGSPVHTVTVCRSAVHVPSWQRPAAAVSWHLSGHPGLPVPGLSPHAHSVPLPPAAPPQPAAPLTGQSGLTGLARHDWMMRGGGVSRQKAAESAVLPC